MLRLPGLYDCLQHVRRRGVVAKGFAHVDKEVFIPGRKHKAAAKLQGIFAQPMLLVSCCLCSFARLQVVFAQKVEQGSVFQPQSLICLAFVVDEKRELDAGFLAEEPGISGVAQAHHSQMSAFAFELGFRFAQLRDMLSAEDSTVVPKEDHHGRSAFPQRAKPRRLAIGVRERNSSELAAE